MIEIKEKYKNQMIQQFMKLNPFNMVVTLKKSDFGYTVEAVNQKAMLLFGHPEKDILVADYFFNQWLDLVPFIEIETTEIIPIYLDNKELFMFYRQQMVINDETYVFLVLHKELQLAQAAYEDELTGLWNLRALQNQWLGFIQQQKELNVAVVLLDLDRFKKFNESLGKRHANELLVLFSRELKENCSENCTLFRLNGDKFIFLIRYQVRQQVEDRMTKVFAMLNKSFTIAGHEYYLTASIGIATSALIEQPKLDKMLDEAERALLYVKKHDRNKHRFYNEEMLCVFPNEALMEAHLRRAVELDELFIHFQPQKSLLTGRVDSFEALIRWQNRKFGFVSPGQFIPLAESSGLILSIGDWVLERVCQYMEEWQGKGYRPVRIAVNISPKQFKQMHFVSTVESLIEKYHIHPSLLELEITESSMMNVQETTLILKQLKKIGVYVSVDDFGTGYSSLSYLKKYPIDIIKIDQSFIADIEKDEKNEAIVKAIILLSHNLGLEVIAEGVEELNQEQFLIEHHCQKVQGYLYNKPLPVEQMVDQYFHN